jgi:tetratricopeptide (TPR) repeat protein
MSITRIVRLSCLVVLLLVTSVPAAVKVWEEPLTLPTYRLDPPDVNPRFYTNESYQGAQKRIYPYAMIDGVTGVREEKTYTALYLENEYVKLCILPEIGGRLWYATDKTNGYEIFYRQHVVKPALIGMLGAWVSGGIEWCVFHHHRNTTHMPVDYTLAANADGSKTIWFGETELRHRMKWLIGVTLRPGSSAIEATVKLFNRTAYPNSILYWANVAVHVNDDYQILFPPSVTAATYHSKNDFAHWPVANERYRGIDYKGVDLSWWKNHPEPVSFFAWDLQEDFMGGYDHGKQAGVVHVGDHHVVCGAKLWEWSPGAGGRAWDKVLTDEDGPYAELMVGAWSDNQPDYSWIGPHEVKTFTQRWYPIREIGGFKNANARAAVNLELVEGKATLGFNVTSRYEKARAILKAGDKTLLEKIITIGPDKPFVAEVAVPEGTKKTDLQATLVTKPGETLISYQPVEIVSDPNLPETVKPPVSPKEIQTVEELYLTGLRIEQIHNPRVNPFDYYEEALARDPNDVRTNTIVGITYNRRMMYEKAEEHLRRAVTRLTAEYTRTRDGEPLYHLAVALRAQGKLDEAYDLFYRASWDHAFRSPSYYELAELSCGRGEFAKALELVDESLATNVLDRKALALKAAILSRQGMAKDAAGILARVLELDPLDFLAMNELSLAQGKFTSRAKAERTMRALEAAMRRDVQAYLELATDYVNWGMWDEARDVLTRAARDKTDATGNSPLVYYYLGFIHERKGEAALAREFYGQASKMASDYCFPFRAETAQVLRAAIARNPRDSRAHYYLGNLLYELQPDRAIECWEQAVAIDGTLAMAHRNLGWACYRTKNDVAKAIASYERAVSYNGKDPRLLTELDELCELGNVEPAKRLAVLEEHQAVAVKRNDSHLRLIMTQVLAGKYDEAVDALAKTQFHVREGGGEIRDVYVDAHVLRGLARLKAGNAKAALTDFQAATEYPENLSVGRPENDPRVAQIEYYTGCAYEVMNQADKAKECFTKAAERQGGFRSPEARFYRGMGMKKMGRDADATAEFEELIKTATERLTRDEQADFFAKFGEQQTRQTQQASAHYLLGLGYLGKGDAKAARSAFETAAKLNVSHVWARMQAAELK